MYNIIISAMLHRRTSAEKHSISMVLYSVQNKSSSPFVCFDFEYVTSKLLNFGHFSASRSKIKKRNKKWCIFLPQTWVLTRSKFYVIKQVQSRSLRIDVHQRVRVHYFFYYHIKCKLSLRVQASFLELCWSYSSLLDSIYTVKSVKDL